MKVRPNPAPTIFAGKRIQQTFLLSRLGERSPHGIAVYALATALTAMLSLLLTRLLWRTLAPAEFGVWALIDPMMLPAASLILLGIDHSIVKQLRMDHLPLRAITGTLLTTTLPASATCLITIGLIARLIFQIDWTGILLLTLAAEALLLLMQTAFRSTGGVKSFAAVLLSRNVLYLCILFAVIVYQAPTQLSISVVFLTRGSCVILVSLAALAAMRPRLRFDWAQYRDALRYGFPLLLTTFVYALSDMTDRWFLAEFKGVVEVGDYALHLKVAAILSQALVVPFGMWFPPERLKHLHDADGGRGFFIRVATILFLLCSYLSGLVWLGRDFILSLIAPGLVVSPVILACCLSAVICLALSQALNVGLLLPGHTAKNAICTACAVISAVAVGIILVPPFGMNGAAISRLCGALVLLGVTAAWSNRVVAVAFPSAAMMLCFAAMTGIAFGLDHLVTARGNSYGLLPATMAWTIATGVFAALLWRRARRRGPGLLGQPSLTGNLT